MNCTIHDNTVLGSLYGFDLGGGIENAGTLLVTNGTVSGNRAERHGGGIANWSKGKTTLVNVTLTNNTADNDGDGDGDGGGVWNEGGLFSVKGTVLAGNHDLSLGAEKPDCFGKLASKRYNLVGNNAGCAIGKAKNLVGIPGGPINPLLGPLQNNGGPTMTHALLPMSPAKDGIPSRNCKDHKNKPLLTDQRGVPRPQGLGCDIGAVEQTP
jgi:hypothetical protein